VSKPSTHRTARRRRIRAIARLAGLRASLGVLQVVAPSRADEWALQLWCTLPPGAGRRRDHRPHPGEVVRLEVPRGGTAAAEVWGEGPVVYLMHGWGGWRGQLGAFVEPLVAAGHRVVAVDAPGHGDADPGFLGAGKGTFMEFLEALEAAGREFGPAAAIIGHSMGSMVAARVARDGIAAERLVLVAPNHSFAEIVEQFAGALGLFARTRRHLVTALEGITLRPLGDFDLELLGADGSMPDTLVLHDRHDKETPFRVGESVAGSWPNAALVASEGLGHHRILTDPGTVASVVAHVTGQVPAPSLD
jgi:pimeloyl-ACP methyl ester carboxylesterase